MDTARSYHDNLYHHCASLFILFFNLSISLKDLTKFSYCSWKLKKPIKHYSTCSSNNAPKSAIVRWDTLGRVKYEGNWSNLIVVIKSKYFLYQVGKLSLHFGPYLREWWFIFALDLKTLISPHSAFLAPIFQLLVTVYLLDMYFWYYKQIDIVPSVFYHIRPLNQQHS